MNYLYNSPKRKGLRRSLRRNQTYVVKKLWSHLRNKQICNQRFLRQYSIGPYIVDFYCPKLRLGVELDGGQHNDPEYLSHDK